MHRKHGPAGLVVITVSLDDMQDEGRPALVRKFLEKMKATCINLVLDEPFEVWSTKFRMHGPPTIYVFNKAGKWKQFKPDDEKGDYHELVLRQVTEWLKEE